MELNIIDLLKSQLGGSVLKHISNFIGEREEGAKSALDAIVPTLLGSLTQKASTQEGASNLFNLIAQGNHDGGILDNITDLFSGGSKSEGLLNSGGNLIQSFLGNKTESIVDLIANFAGIRKNSTSTLLKFAAPLVMGFLGKQVKSKGLNVAGLASLLLGQSNFIKNALPAGLSQISSLLGFTGLLEGSGNSTPATSLTKPKATGIKWWPWLLALVALALLWYLSKSCNPQKVADATTTAIDSIGNKADRAAEATTSAVNAAWAHLGTFFKKSLPGGYELNIPEKGIENKLIDFIEDSSKPVDKTTWFSFDRLLFETGKSTLKPESAEQLKNIAAIMAAYPKVNIKLGGYTDNTGDSKANMQLSQARAESVMAELVKSGVAANRLAAEGYGDQHPVASNDTEEGRAKNRRIDLRVSAK